MTTKDQCNDSEETQHEESEQIDESVTDDPIFDNLRTIGDPLDPEDQKLIHQRFIIFHFIKFCIYFPVFCYLSRLYTISKLTNAISDILRIIGNLFCLWASDPLKLSADLLLSDSIESASLRIPFDVNAAYWKHCIYHIGVVVSDVFTPLSKLTKVIQKIAILSIIYWFIHWREFEGQSEFVHESYATFFASLRFGVAYIRDTARTALRAVSPVKAVTHVRGLVCGIALVLMEAYSLYYIYAMV